MVAREENWTGQRKKYRDDTLIKTLDKIEDNKSQRLAKLFQLTDIVLDTLLDIVKGKDRKAFLADPKKFTGAIKDIKEIYMIRSSEDLDEQRARIQKLKKDVESCDKEGSSTVEVVFAKEDDEWAK